MHLCHNQDFVDTFINLYLEGRSELLFCSILNMHLSSKFEAD